MRLPMKLVVILFMSFFGASLVRADFVSVAHEVPIMPYKNCDRLGWSSNRLELVQGAIYFLDNKKGLCVSKSLHESPEPLTLHLEGVPYEMIGFIDFKIVYPVVYFLVSVRNDDDAVVVYNLLTQKSDFSLPHPKGLSQGLFVDKDAAYVLANSDQGRLTRIDLHTKEKIEFLTGDSGLHSFVVVGDSVFYSPAFQDLKVLNWRTGVGRSIQLNGFDK